MKQEIKRLEGKKNVYMSERKVGKKK